MQEERTAEQSRLTVSCLVMPTDRFGLSHLCQPGSKLSPQRCAKAAMRIGR